MTDRTGHGTGLGRRDVLRLAGAGATVGLAGCGNRSGTPTPSGTPGSGGDALAGETLTVGVLAPMPDGNPLGKAVANGARLAARHLSKEGVLGAGVDVAVGNTEASPGKAGSEYERLVGKEGADVTVGVFLDQVLKGVLPHISQRQTLHFTTGAIGLEAPRLVSKEYEKYKYHFRAGPINAADIATAQLEFLAQYADPLGWSSVALVVEDFAPFDPLYERISANAGDHVNLVEDGRTPPDLRDWRTVFDNVEASGADLMLVGQSISGIAAAKIWGDQRRPFEYGGIHVPSMVHEFYKEVDGACEYIFSMNAVTPQSENTPRTQPFMDAYRKAFGRVPGFAAPITYDAVLMYADAVRETGSTDPEELIPYLEQRAFTDGVTFPEHRFQGPNDQFPHDPVWESTAKTGVPLWQQWQSRDGEGVQAVVAPDRLKTAEYQHPPWLK